MRGVVDKGTGVAIRSRYGMRADVAGKTGTTQDNTDGWFILMHPQLVAGAWVGFNDNRITLRSDYWGQGARSALPIVGERAGTQAHSPASETSGALSAGATSARAGGTCAGAVTPAPHPRRRGATRNRYHPGATMSPGARRPSGG
jgi:membrane peptidoglycan carboxypeptidase